MANIIKTRFMDYADRLRAIKKWDKEDKERAHSEGVQILKEVALDIHLFAGERRQLVELYDNIEGW